MALLVSGNVVRMSRDLGTPSPTDSFVTTENTIVAKLDSALPTTYRLRAINEATLLALALTTINYIRFGNILPSKVYLGNNLVSRIYLGNTLVYNS